jgi:hypothetical protein
MHPFSFACLAVMITCAVELLVGCGLSEEGQRQREVVYVTHRSADAHAGIDMSPEDITPEDQSTVDPAVTPTTDEDAEMDPLLSMPVRFGVRDFAQINATMSQLTGILATTTAIATLYNTDLITQLPTNNDLKSFLASHQVGISKLATEYCDALLANTTLRASVLTGFNFNQPPATALADAPAGTVAAALIDRFVGPQMEFHSDRGTMQSELKNLIRELVQSAPAATPAETLNILKGACTAVLASSSVMTF